MSPEDETRLWDYSVQGIVNLLENNTHAGLAEALGFCYHEDPDIRSIFVAIFAKALERSVDLSSAVQEHVDKRHSYICEVGPETITTYVPSLIDRPHQALKAPDVCRVNYFCTYRSHVRFPATARFVDHRKLPQQ